MGGLIRLEDIEEFRLVRHIARQDITSDTLEGVRQLNEITEIERFLREILPDPTETPHDRGEIGDILTPHVSYSGRPHLAAFVNKGKSFAKVTSKNTGLGELQVGERLVSRLIVRSERQTSHRDQAMKQTNTLGVATVVGVVTVLTYTLVVASTPLTYRPVVADGILTPLIVNTTDDIADGSCDNKHCSLREAILTANEREGPDNIVFDKLVFGPDPQKSPQ